LCGPKALRRTQFDNLNRLGQPIVVFQEAFSSSAPNVAVVSQDDVSGGKQLGQHLLKKRLRSVVFVRPALEWCALEHREKGLRSVLASAAPAIDVKTLISASEQFDDVQQIIKDHLARTTPDAIVAATDSMAAAALKTCELAGIRVPKDILIAGFNGFDVWRYTSPTMTTVVSPAYELGRQAGELLIQRLRTGSFPKRNLVLPVRLQPGDST
jgi:LacI family transcriptional regulator